MSKKAILVISFGTSYAETRKKSIEAIEHDLTEAFPGYDFYRAFTSPTICRILKERDGIEIDLLKPALQKLIDWGYDTVVAQPTHMICGFEYDRMKQTLEQYRSRFEQLYVGEPLLTSEEDYQETVDALAQELQVYRKTGTDIVLMGHGTEHEANSTYARLQAVFAAAGMDDMLVGTVEASPTLENMVELVKKRRSEHVILTPLMVVAGDHANNDMAGEEDDSWKSRFQKQGYEVQCVLKGLGEYPSIRDIYVRHAREAAR